MEQRASSELSNVFLNYHVKNYKIFLLEALTFRYNNNNEPIAHKYIPSYSELIAS